MALPAVTVEQMQEVDRIMVDELGIGLIQMMENAGRLLARHIVDQYAPSSVLILAGPGGNGGGALVAARNLANWGVDVTITLSSTELAPVAALQAAIVRRMGITVGEPRSADVIADGLVGYSLAGPARGRAAVLIAQANSAVAPTVALDVPSGLDPDTGVPPGVAVEAASTVTLAAPKAGLIGSPLVGDLWLADISVPPSVFAQLGIDVPADTFASGALVRVR